MSGVRQRFAPRCVRAVLRCYMIGPVVNVTFWAVVVVIRSTRQGDLGRVPGRSSNGSLFVGSGGRPWPAGGSIRPIWPEPQRSEIGLCRCSVFWCRCRAWSRLRGPDVVPTSSGGSRRHLENRPHRRHRGHEQETSSACVLNLSETAFCNTSENCFFCHVPTSLIFLDFFFGTFFNFFDFLTQCSLPIPPKRKHHPKQGLKPQI